MRAFSKRAFSVFAVVVVVFSAFVVASRREEAGGAEAAGSLPTPPAHEAARRLTLATGESTSPQAFSSKDRLLVAWLDGRDGGDRVFLKSSRDRGQAFTADRAASPRADAAANLTASGDAAGTSAAVAWDALGNGGRHVFYLFSSDGDTWSPAIDAGPGLNPSILVRGQTAYLCFLTERVGQRGTVLQAVAVPHGDGGPGNATGLSSWPVTGTEVACALDGGTLHVVWDEWDGEWTALLHAAIDLATSAIHGPTLIRSVNGRIGAGSLALAVASGRLAFAWSDASAGYSAVYVGGSVDGGQTWWAGMRASPQDVPARDPGMALNSTGAPHLTWSDRRSGSWQVYRRFGGGDSGRGYEHRLSDSSGAASRPSIAANGKDATAVVWEDTRHGAAELYADFDSDLASPLPRSWEVLARRLPAQAFRSPAETSRPEVLAAIRDVARFLGAADARAALAHLRTVLRPMLDGHFGGDSRDDRIVERKAQEHLLPRLDALARELEEGLGGGGTRALPPELPGPPGDKPFVVFDYQVAEVTPATARITWAITLESEIGTEQAQVDASWVDYWLFGQSEVRRWDNATPYDVNLTSLVVGKEYHFKIGAEMSNGDTAWTRNDTFWTKVVISDVAVTAINYTAATVTWKTNTNSTTVVYYGTTNNYGSAATGANGTEHSVALTNLTAKTLYHFTAESVSTYSSSLQDASGDRAFRTGIDLVGNPSQGSPSAGVTAMGFSILWTTTMAGTSRVLWGTTPSLGSVATGANGTVHTVQIVNPPTASTIHYKAESTSLADATDTVQSTAFTFSSLAISIGNRRVDPVGASTASIRWETTLSNGMTRSYANTVVLYGITETESYPYKATGADGWDHGVNLTGLTGGATYHYQVMSNSTSNTADAATVRNRTFTTTGIALSGAVNPYPVAATYAVIRWNTTVAGTSEVRIHTGACGGGRQVAAANGTAHVVNVTGLSPLTDYSYFVRSRSTANLNDSVKSSCQTFQTPYQADDAGSLTDAGGTTGTALQAVPGNYTGQLQQTLDLSDHFKFWGLSGQRLAAFLDVPSGHDYDLALLDPSGSSVASSAQSGSADETVAYNLTQTGFWYVRTTYVSGTGYAVYGLRFNVTGSWLDRFDLDVGKSGDGDVNAHLPGISLNLSSGWSGVSTSGSASTASWEELSANPDYRQSVVNSSFFLNLHGYSAQRYTDYRVTLQYYATQDANLSVYNGGGWVVLGALEGRSAWHGKSFLLPHTHLFDAEPSLLGWNVAFRIANVTQLNKISARAAGYVNYVGNGSDDADWTFHLPGVLLDAGWVDEGQGYKNGTEGATLLLTIPEPSIAHEVSLSFNNSDSFVWVSQWNGTGWTTIARLADFAADPAFSLATTPWATADADSRPGRNLRLRFEGEVRELTAVRMRFAGSDDDLGDSDDGDLLVHDPGITILKHASNREWSSSAQYDTPSGRWYRHGDAGADVYLNDPAGPVDHLISVTYRASADGAFRQWTGVGWISLGTIHGTGSWRTDNFTASGLTLTDWYGSYGINARFEFTVAVDVDSLAASPDGDSDDLSEFQETYPYAVADAADRWLDVGDTAFYDVFAGGAGRYQFELYLNGSSSRFSVEIDYHRKLDLTGVLGFVTLNATLCDGWHRLSLYHGGNPFSDPDVLVDEVRWYRDPTRPDQADSDQDGREDRLEACDTQTLATQVDFALEPTDPLNPDTDFDGMTDFQELFSFTYQDSTSHSVTPSANYTLNLTLPDTGAFVFTVGASGSPAAGKTATLSVLANGLPAYRHGANASWTHTETFDARLVRGHNSLVFSLEEASGSATVTSILIDKDGWLTSPTDPDTDRDGLWDGVELNGDTGWVLNPTDPDHDGDGIQDGREVGHFFTDPTNPDTDGDGTGDDDDFDKLHDVVVQVELGGLTITAGHDPNRQYTATAGIEGAWARTKSSGAVSFDLDHVVSVDTADSDWVAQYNLTVRDSTGQLVDLTPSTSTKEVAGDGFLATESWCGTTTGTTSPAASLYYCVRTVKVGKENTLLVIPGDWSTVQNGSTGLHRYVSEQKFVFVFLNVTGSSANFSAGMNAILVPRGIYYDTAFHRLLNDTWANASSSPLVGATVIGNEAGNARGLNARRPAPRVPQRHRRPGGNSARQAPDQRLRREDRRRPRRDRGVLHPRLRERRHRPRPQRGGGEHGALRGPGAAAGERVLDRVLERDGGGRRLRVGRGAGRRRVRGERDRGGGAVGPHRHPALRGGRLRGGGGHRAGDRGRDFGGDQVLHRLGQGTTGTGFCILRVNKVNCK